MIAVIKGEVFRVNDDNFIIMTGGVGYRVYAPVANFKPIPMVGEQILLYTYHQVREDAMLLFGFADETELSLFELLLSVNGVGAKTALLILNNLSFEQICQSIMTGNSQALSKIPGIGKKTVDRIILELGDKINRAGWVIPQADIEKEKEAEIPQAQNLINTAITALNQLGYNAATASSLVKKAAAKLESDCTVEELISAALRAANQ
jgi:Holliday junction DNA helicase RuvA